MSLNQFFIELPNQLSQFNHPLPLNHMIIIFTRPQGRVTAQRLPIHLSQTSDLSSNCSYHSIQYDFNGVARRQLYAAGGGFFIKSLVDGHWVKLPHRPGYLSHSFQYVMRPIFTPGNSLVIQYTKNATLYDRGGEIAKNVYRWKATINATDLYDIRVKEYEFGLGDINTIFRIRIELITAFRVPLAGQGLMTATGVKRVDVLDHGVDTSESVASSVAVGNIADGWLSANQEIELAFSQTTQLK